MPDEWDGHAAQPPTRTMLFRRQFKRFNGGHRKVWDYFEHVRASGRYSPAVYFAPESDLGHSNPWVSRSSRSVTHWEPHRADALFLGGIDWKHVPEQLTVPVLNLVQNVWHADPEDERFPFLRRRAFRVCVSEEVADAVRSSGQANGPVITVPIGVEHEPVVTAGVTRTVDVVIAGVKNVPFAEELAARLASLDITVECLTRWVPRLDLCSAFARSRVAVTLPAAVEGFFLPPLEAMAQGCTVVCPTSPGTGSYHADRHALRPAYTPDSVAASVREALLMEPARRQSLLDAGKALVRQHTLEAERRTVFEVLEMFDGNW